MDELDCPYCGAHVTAEPSLDLRTVIARPEDPSWPHDFDVRVNRCPSCKRVFWTEK